jgi:hypothetical protein
MRKALELSIIVAPDSTIVFAQAFEVDPPRRSKNDIHVLKRALVYRFD